MTTVPATVPLPLRIARLTRNEAQARSLLAQRAAACTVRLGGMDWQLSLEPLSESASHAGPEAGDWLVRAQWAGAPFALRLPAAAAEAWLRGRFPDLDLPALPDEVRAAALEGALEQALTALAALQRGPARIESVGPEAAATPGLDHRFALLLAQPGAALEAQLATSSLGLMLMAGLVAQLAPARGPLDADAVAMLLRAEIGSTLLPADQLASLAVGDAILFDHAWIAQEGELWLGQGRWGLKARWDDRSLVVTQPFTETGLTMPTDTESVPQADGASALDAVPVRLQFDIGERSMTLGELKALQVGQSLELGRPLSQAVIIRANGALVGSGELVEIDGRLGVTITALGRASGPSA
ncbi:MAG TPA: type III secretion system cytoplasmic ring protein SctQ [Ramlibacter sp.]|nr:type III secretion system cytoplasmic ring protein SctQ [Ramlibacter sp.]